MSKLFGVIRNMYIMHRITSAQVWKYVDKKKLTEDEAVLICGPRPEA